MEWTKDKLTSAQYIIERYGGIFEYTIVVPNSPMCTVRKQPTGLGHLLSLGFSNNDGFYISVTGQWADLKTCQEYSEGFNTALQVMAWLESI